MNPGDELGEIEDLGVVIRLEDIRFENSLFPSTYTIGIYPSDGYHRGVEVGDVYSEVDIDDIEYGDGIPSLNREYLGASFSLEDENVVCLIDKEGVRYWNRYDTRAGAGSPSNTGRLAVYHGDHSERITTVLNRDGEVVLRRRIGGGTISECGELLGYHHYSKGNRELRIIDVDLGQVVEKHELDVEYNILMRKPTDRDGASFYILNSSTYEPAYYIDSDHSLKEV